MVSRMASSRNPWCNNPLYCVFTLVLLDILHQRVACEYTELGDECSSCEAGKYMNQPGQTTCKSCGAGTWFDLTGGDEEEDCNKCGFGTFSNTVAATNVGTCDECPAGMSCL